MATITSTPDSHVANANVDSRAQSPFVFDTMYRAAAAAPKTVQKESKIVFI